MADYKIKPKSNEELGALAGRLVDGLKGLSLSQKRIVLSMMAFNFLPFEGSISHKAVSPEPSSSGRPVQRKRAGGKKGDRREVTRTTSTKTRKTPGIAKGSELNPTLKQQPGFLVAHKALQLLDKKIKKGIKDAKKAGGPDYVVTDGDKSRKLELIAQLRTIRDQVEPERAVRIQEQRAKNEAARQRNLNRKQPRADAVTSSAGTESMDIPIEGCSGNLFSGFQSQKGGNNSGSGSESGKTGTQSQLQ